MFRVLGLAFLIAIVASVISNGNSVVVGIAFVGTLALVALPLLSGQGALKCPHCRKRVKLGATVCHHCQRSVARPVK